jgi:hypothetical protein
MSVESITRRSPIVLRTRLDGTTRPRLVLETLAPPLVQSWFIPLALKWRTVSTFLY